MRASRILKMLMMLQTHEKVTAAELADACETSIRTVYRDIEALSAIGVPVYSEQGVQGGYRLLQGYRTRLNGLSAKEAETLFLAGLSGPAQKMGIDTLLADAQLKLKAALPENIRPEIDRLQSRFLLDAPNWFSDDEKVTYLPDLMTAVLEQRCVVMQYQSWKGEINRQLQPLGIVLKGGQWYLLAQVEKDVRTYRVSRIESLTLLDEVFERPKDFNLAAFWQDSLRRMETIQFPIIAEVRLTVLGLKIMQYVCSSYAVNQAQIEPMDESGWHRARFPVGESVYGCAELLRFGVELEVIGPPELRAEMEKMVSSLAKLYQQDATRSLSN